MIHDVISFTLLAFSAIFFVVDPFAVVPVFVSMTEGDDASKRARMALKACMLCAGAILPLGMPLLAGPARGRAILERTMGLLLAAVAVELIIDGLREALPELFSR